MQGRAAEGNAPIARVDDDGSVNHNVTNRDNDNRNLLFRPAAIGDWEVCSSFKDTILTSVSSCDLESEFDFNLF